MFIDMMCLYMYHDLDLQKKVCCLKDCKLQVSNFHIMLHLYIYLCYFSDFGYQPNDRFGRTHCVLSKDVDNSEIHIIPDPCPIGTFYPYTRGLVDL